MQQVPSILSNAKSSMVVLKPFPHIIIQDAIPQNFADQLTTKFPKNLYDLSYDNKRIDINSYKAIHSNHISPEWRDFVAYHSSKDFFAEFIDIFNVALQDYRDVDFDDLKNLQVGRREEHSFSSKDFLLDAQISLNTPALTKNSVRQAHVDNENKLFSGLFYLRQPDDHSTGGNLQLCSWPINYSEKQKLKNYREGVHAKHYEIFKEVEYQNNIAILFLNSLDALHCVTPRDPTSNIRTFMNLVCETPHNIFTKYTYTEKILINTKTTLKNLIYPKS
mgnify:CR=1 FL=1|tara:strand:- start:47 stop:877 length:831 start_codon:yes stop_codon:yes gene_type:complete